jgi:hypothetical protein
MKPAAPCVIRTRRLLSAPLVLALLGLLVFEEWLWSPLSRAIGQLARWPVWARLERGVAALPAWAALPLFLVPVLTLLPFKLLALWLMAQHHVLLGFQMIVLAKLVGTAIAARLYTLLAPTLLAVPWFASLHAQFVRLRDWVFTRWHSMWAYQLWLRLRQAIRQRPGWLGPFLRRWRRLRRQGPSGLSVHRQE